MATSFQTTPDQVKNGAGAICEEGNHITSNVTSIYTTISGLNQVWVGTAYNNLATAFNNMLPSLNSVCSFISYTIPHTLVLAMNNYLAADNSPVRVEDPYSPPVAVGEIPLGATDHVDWQEGDVVSAQSIISGKFDEIINGLDRVLSEVNRLSWSGEAADTVRAVLRTYKDQLSDSFVKTKTQFQTSIDETRAGFTTADTQNTVD